jgi:hypothetical protein
VNVMGDAKGLMSQVPLNVRMFMRSLLKHKTSPIEFTLPPRSENLPTEMAKGYREGGRVRLI